MAIQVLDNTLLDFTLLEKEVFIQDKYSHLKLHLHPIEPDFERKGPRMLLGHLQAPDVTFNEEVSSCTNYFKAGSKPFARMATPLTVNKQDT